MAKRAERVDRWCTNSPANELMGPTGRHAGGGDDGNRTHDPLLANLKVGGISRYRGPDDSRKVLSIWCDARIRWHRSDLPARVGARRIDTFLIHRSLSLASAQHWTGSRSDTLTERASGLKVASVDSLVEANVYGSFNIALLLIALSRSSTKPWASAAASPLRSSGPRTLTGLPSSGRSLLARRNRS